MNKYDICIIGAGVAGSAMAAYLGDNGLRVVIIEKDLREQDRIVGELMQPGGVNQLRRMGLECTLEGFDAQPVPGYALYLKDQHFCMPYPDGETGRGLHNGRFMQAQRKYITGHKNITVIEGNVVALNDEAGTITGVKYIAKGEDNTRDVSAMLTVVCDGMFSVFREALSDNPKKVSSYFLGFIMRDCVLPYPNHGHVIAAEPSPVLAYPISSTETRVLIDFPTAQPPRKSPELIAYLRDQLAPQMPVEIQPHFLAAVEEGKFKVMPNHLIPSVPKHIRGAVLIGDALNMRHPLTGGGMTVALSDVQYLGEKLIGIREHFTREQIDREVFAFYDTRYERNASINILADALYGVMSDADLKDACYTYLQMGGSNASIPLSLLSGLNRDQDLLLKHFFAVAIHGAKNIVMPDPSVANIKRSYRMIKNAVQIISPLILNQKPGPLTKATFTVAEKIF